MSVPVQCPNPDCRAFGVVAEAALGQPGRCRKCRRVFALARAGAAPAGGELPPTTPYQAPAPAGAEEDLPERFGRYRIRRRLGRGGMGAVYLARDPKLRRWVALKVPSLATSEGPRAILRFEREARAAATLDHPNLCPVFDFGVVDGVPYLTMPFIDGRPLSDRIGRGRRLAEAEAAAIARTLALALHEAHGRGVVHRDLKPSNILFNRRGELVVVDFGLARLEDDDAAITGAGLALGTALYMAPEQAAGEDGAGRPAVDIYALGVILYELLAEVRPFDGPRSFVIALKTYRDPAPPSAHRPNLHPALDAICLRALARDPADRFSSMADFARALADFAAGIPTPAGDPVPPDPGSIGPDTPARRRLGRPAAVGLIAGAALLLLALLPFAAPGRGQVEDAGGPGAVAEAGVRGAKALDSAATGAVEQRPEAPPAPAPRAPAAAPAPVESHGLPGAVASKRDLPPPVGGVRGDWRIEGDELVQSSLALGLDAHPYLAFGDANWSEYDLTFEAKKVAGDEGFLVLFHWRDEATYGQLGLGTRENRDFDLRFYDQARSRYVIQDARPGRIEEGRWYPVRLEVRGPACRCYLGPDLLFEKSRAERDRGRVGFATWKTAVRFRAVRVSAPDGRTLFEGLPDPAARPSTPTPPPDAAEAMAGRVKAVERSLVDDPPPGDAAPGRPAPGPFQPLFAGGILRETLLLRGGGEEGEARWAVEDGLLVARGPGEAAFLVQKQLRDFDLRAEVQRADGDAAGLLLLRADEKGDRPRGYSVGLGRSRADAGTEPDGADADAGAVQCRATVPANSVELARGAPADAPPPDAWFRVEVKARGPALTVRVGDGPALTAVDPRRLFAHGLVGFSARGGGGGRPALKIRRIEVRPVP